MNSVLYQMNSISSTLNPFYNHKTCHKIFENKLDIGLKLILEHRLSFCQKLNFLELILQNQVLDHFYTIKRHKTTWIKVKNLHECHGFVTQKQTSNFSIFHFKTKHFITFNSYSIKPTSSTLELPWKQFKHPPKSHEQPRFPAPTSQPKSFSKNLVT